MLTNAVAFWFRLKNLIYVGELLLQEEEMRILETKFSIMTEFKNLLIF